ncbi:MAG: hypothetical protein ACO2OS_04655, partial [Thermosphaera aggregans]|uniref:hypothetical protein n=1 Tax=Thermosphaera aggregans TaxID=54254 RepID=UPI003C100750
AWVGKPLSILCENPFTGNIPATLTLFPVLDTASSSLLTEPVTLRGKYYQVSRWKGTRIFERSENMATAPIIEDKGVKASFIYKDGSTLL